MALSKYKIAPYFCLKGKIKQNLTMKKILSLVCFFILFSFSTYGEETLLEIKQQLDRMNREIIDLQKSLFQDKKNFSTETTNLIDVSEITVFDMRLRDIENELKTINFNYENLVFEIDELKNSFQEFSIKLNNIIINKEESIINKEAEYIEDNVDADIQGQQNEPNSLGILKINSEDLSDKDNSISQNEEKEISQDLLPEEQFQIAFDLLRSQKFEEAKSALKIFIQDNPSNVLSGSAHYWLGEIYLLKKENREAALIFAEGYQKYPKSIKSPDSLYKLSEALLKIEKENEACDILNQFILKYPKHKLIEKTKSRINEIKCS